VFLGVLFLSCGAPLPPATVSPATTPAPVSAPVQEQEQGQGQVPTLPPMPGPRSAPPIRLAALLPPDQPAAPPARTIVVVSDLHFGLGGLGAATHGEGAWDRYEDFRWAAEWNAFLERIDKEGGGATDLILNGDAFELWQSRSGDCRSGDADLG